MENKLKQFLKNCKKNNIRFFDLSYSDLTESDKEIIRMLRKDEKKSSVELENCNSVVIDIEAKDYLASSSISYNSEHYKIFLEMLHS